MLHFKPIVVVLLLGISGVAARHLREGVEGSSFYDAPQALSDVPFYHSTVERLRLACLSRGASDIKGLERTFRTFDDDRSKTLDFSEFQEGVRDYGLHLEPNEVQEIFDGFDKDGSKALNFDEFLVALIPPMSNRRESIIRKAFTKLDRTGDGLITAKDLKGVDDVTKHLKCRSGEWTEEQCFNKYLETFDNPDDKDGTITLEEFMNYYSGVSAFIDNDAHFDLMVRTMYKL